VSLEVKQPGREAEHSPPHSAEVKSTWIYTFSPPYVSIMWHLVVVIKQKKGLYCGPVVKEETIKFDVGFTDFCKNVSVCQTSGPHSGEHGEYCRRKADVS
jgi:hypothetical protein